MALHICSSPSLHLLCNSLSSSWKLKTQTLNCPPQSYLISPHSKLSLHTAARVSTQDAVLQVSEDPDSDSTTTQSPDEKSNSSSINSVWINPNNPRASKLKKKSYDARYGSLLKVAESLNSCDATESDVSGILSSALGDVVLVQEAVTVLNIMTNAKNALIALRYFQNKFRPRKDVILYNVTMKVFRKCGELDSAEKLFAEMLERGIRPDNVSFSTIISCARMCKLPAKAVEWFEKMPGYGCSPDDITYSAMIDAYGQAGNVQMAMTLYDRARTEKWPISAITFATLIKIYGQSKNFDGCLNVFEEMKALGVKPNVVIYNSLLDAMGRARRPWQAKSLFREMISKGFIPTWKTYAALIHAYARARYTEDALSIYKEMKEKGLEINTKLYNTLLSMCADVGLVDEGIKIFEDLKKSETCMPDSWTFSSLITVYSCTGKVSEAEDTLNQMLEAGFEPNIFVLTSIIQCYGKAQRTDDVVRTVNQVFDLGIVPDDRFSGCLLNVMTTTPKEELNKLIYCIEKANSKLGHVVKHLIQGDDDQGGNFNNDISELFNSISPDVKKAYCNCLIDLCVSSNKWDRAGEVFELGTSLEIYTEIQSKSPTQWSLHLKSLSLGAAMTALRGWMKDLKKALDEGEEVPPLLGINTGHGKHKYSEKALAGAFESHLKELNAPFHESPEKLGWFLTTKVAATSWLEKTTLVELATA